MRNAGKRRCKATSRSGERCRAHVVNAAGYCVAHDPEKPADMRALGRKSGEARRRPNPRRVPESLREELRNLDPKVVRAAIEQTLAGGNESARVSAVKLLADVDAFRKDSECPRCAAMAADGPGDREEVLHMLERHIEAVVRQDWFGAEFVDSQGVVRERGGDSQVTAMIRRAVRRAQRGHEAELDAAVEFAFGKVIDSLAGGFVPGDVTAEQAANTLRALEEVGLLVPRGRVEELAEEIAQERLRALRQEHSVA